MIGILGGMGTQAGLDFCNKLAKLYKGKIDQKYPLFVLYNKSNIPGRPENLNKYNKVLKSLLNGCKFLEKNIKEVQVQFKNEPPAWIPYETLLAIEESRTK